MIQFIHTQETKLKREGYVNVTVTTKCSLYKSTRTYTRTHARTQVHMRAYMRIRNALLPALFSLFSGTQVRLPAMHVGYRMPRSLLPSWATEKEKEGEGGKGRREIIRCVNVRPGSRNREISRLSTPRLSTFNSSTLGLLNCRAVWTTDPLSRSTLRVC